MYYLNRNKHKIKNYMHMYIIATTEFFFAEILRLSHHRASNSLCWFPNLAIFCIICTPVDLAGMCQNSLCIPHTVCIQEQYLGITIISSMQSMLKHGTMWQNGNFLTPGAVFGSLYLPYPLFRIKILVTGRICMLHVSNDSSSYLWQCHTNFSQRPWRILKLLWQNLSSHIAWRWKWARTYI